MDETFTEAMVVIMSIMSFVIVFINGGCIYIIYSSKVLRQKRASIFVYSILTLHLLQGCFVIPFYAAKKSKHEKSVAERKLICDGFRLTYMVTFYGACINVLLIGGDRLLAVQLMTSYKIFVTRKRAIVATVSLWAYTVLLCLIPFIPQEEPKFCRYNQQDEWTTFMLFINTLLPYVVVIVSYVYITIKLDKMAQKTRSYSDHQEEVLPPVPKKSRALSTFTMFVLNKRHENEEEQERDKNIRKVTKLTFIIILAYGLTWAPSIFYYTLLKVAPSLFSEEYLNSPAESYVTFFIKFITFFDAIFTPIIYCYFHNDFRREFDKFWHNLRKRSDVIEIKDESSLSSSRPRSCTSW